MFNICRKVDRILELVTFIEKRVEKMAVDQATFDAQLTELTNAITKFIADVAAKTGVDLTNESAQVTAALAAIAAADPNAVPPTTPAA